MSQAKKLFFVLFTGATLLLGGVSAFAAPPLPSWCAGTVGNNHPKCEWRVTNDYQNKTVEVLSATYARPFYQSDTLTCSNGARDCTISRTVGSNTCQTNSTGTTSTLGTTSDLKAAVKIWEIVELGISGSVAQSYANSTDNSVRTCTNSAITYACRMGPSTRGHIFSRYKVQKVKVTGKRRYVLYQWKYTSANQTYSSSVNPANDIYYAFSGTTNRPSGINTGCAVVKN